MGWGGMRMVPLVIDWWIGGRVERYSKGAALFCDDPRQMSSWPSYWPTEFTRRVNKIFPA